MGLARPPRAFLGPDAVIPAGLQALPPLPAAAAGARDAGAPSAAAAVQPHALEEHAPALAGPAAVSAPGGAPADGEGNDAGVGGGGAGGARDVAVSLAALWCAHSALMTGVGGIPHLLCWPGGLVRRQTCAVVMDTPRRQP